MIVDNAIIDLEAKLEAAFLKALYQTSRASSAHQLQIYATACFNVVLQHSDEIQIIFDLMLQLWQLPDYQKLMWVYHKRLPETRQWYRQYAWAIMHNQPKPDFPAVQGF
jgi:hypothetical protein